MDSMCEVAPYFFGLKYTGDLNIEGPLNVKQ